MGYFIVFFCLLVFSSIIVNGWFLVTRGSEEIQPDNSIKRTGKILMSWYFFWTKKRGYKKIFYQREELRCLIERINRDARTKVEIYGEARMIVMPTFKEDIPKLQTLYDICIEIEPQENGPFYAVAYKIEEDYIFPEWVRDMMAECVTCHATFYGNIIFWTFMALCRTDELGYDMGVWNELNGLSLVGTWVAYWLSLAWLNTFIYQRLKH